MTSVLELIDGQRIYLKKHDLQNAETMFNIIAKDRHNLDEFLPWVKSTHSVKDSDTFIRITLDCWKLNKAYEYGIYLKSNHQYIGNIGAINLNFHNQTCEIGYWLWSKYSGNGYMLEAVSILEQHLFSMGFFRIEIRCEPLNLKSQAVALNNAYKLDGTLRGNCIVNGNRRDSLVYSKILTDLQEESSLPIEN